MSVLPSYKHTWQTDSGFMGGVFWHMAENPHLLSLYEKEQLGHSAKYLILCFTKDMKMSE